MVLLLVGIQGFVTAKIWSAGQDHAGLVVASAVGMAAELAWFIVGPRVILAGVIVAAVAVPLVDRKNIERQTRSTRNAAAQLRSIVGDGPVAVASENRNTPELFFYANVEVEAFGERGLARLAEKPGGRWAVVSQNKLFPEYKTLASQIPGAFPRGVVQLKMPNPRDVVYVGWYDPPAGVARVVTLPTVSSDVEADDE